VACRIFERTEWCVVPPVPLNWARLHPLDHRNNCRGVVFFCRRTLQPVEPIVLHQHCIFAICVLLHAIVRDVIGRSWTQRRIAIGHVVIRFGNAAMWHCAIDEHPYCCTCNCRHGKWRVSTSILRHSLVSMDSSLFPESRLVSGNCKQIGSKWFHAPPIQFHPSSSRT
jgi:hypothetical protein